MHFQRKFWSSCIIYVILNKLYYLILYRITHKICLSSSKYTQASLYSCPSQVFHKHLSFVGKGYEHFLLICSSEHQQCNILAYKALKDNNPCFSAWSWINKLTVQVCTCNGKKIFLKIIIGYVCYIRSKISEVTLQGGREDLLFIRNKNCTHQWVARSLWAPSDFYLRSWFIKEGLLWLLHK